MHIADARSQHPRRQRHRRRGDRHRHRCGACREAARQRPGRRRVLRRWRRQRGHLPRGAESRRRCGSCRSSTCARTTSTACRRRCTSRRRLIADRGSGRELFDARRHDRRQRCPRRVRRRCGVARRARARRRRADADRGDHVPLGRSQHARQSSALSQEEEERRVAQARSDRRASKRCWRAMRAFRRSRARRSRAKPSTRRSTEAVEFAQASPEPDARGFGERGLRTALRADDEPTAGGARELSLSRPSTRRSAQEMERDPRVFVLRRGRRQDRRHLRAPRAD